MLHVHVLLTFIKDSQEVFHKGRWERMSNLCSQIFKAILDPFKGEKSSGNLEFRVYVEEFALLQVQLTSAL